eukprot:13238837-Alexandrium_andersonii.AAC.1
MERVMAKPHGNSFLPRPSVGLAHVLLRAALIAASVDRSPLAALQELASREAEIAGATAPHDALP